MFELGWVEIGLIGVIALVVLGPERLPGAARTAGLWVGRLKRSFNSIKQEVEREIGADEIRRQLHNEHILSMEQEARRILNPQSVTPDPASTPGTQPVAAAEPAPTVETAQVTPVATPEPAPVTPPSTEPTQPPRAP